MLMLGIEQTLLVHGLLLVNIMPNVSFNPFTYLFTFIAIYKIIYNIFCLKITKIYNKSYKIPLQILLKIN